MNAHENVPAAVHARRAGISASIGGPLLLAGAVASTVVSVQQPDGTVTDPALFTLYTTTFTAGAALLAHAVLALWALHRATDEPAPRSLRIGARISLIGFVLLTLFGVIVAATGLATGAPSEASFVAFGLGFLLTVIGHATLAVGLRRAGNLRSLWIAPLVASAGALLALLASDLWHDLGLLVLTAAWTTLGARLIARTRPDHAPPSRPLPRRRSTATS
jgi:cytochrome bd-type quinol oxidase subunit 2